MRGSAPPVAGLFVLALMVAACRPQSPSLAPCSESAACAGETCLGGLCRPLTCADARVNGHETDVDCGGPFCVGCAADRVCLGDTDCESAVCTLSRCAAPSCFDAVQNGGESGVDCGGPCAGCAAPIPSCSDGQRNGTETDVDCGGACAACGPGLTCARNTDCGTGACADGHCVDPCGAPLMACSGACVHVQFDRNHCGACGVSCAVGQACLAGKCELPCAGGSRQCGAACISPASDPANCGGCGMACGAGQICVGGQCFSACPPGQAPCGGSCVSLDRDSLNCGSCGKACPQGGACVGGQCAAGCNAPLRVCATGPTACVDPQNDPGHCGGCGMPCPIPPNAAPACAGSACVLGPCQPGFSNCNGAAPDGCEAELAVDPIACGTCGHVCVGSETCTLGKCCGLLPEGSYQTTCVGCEACDGILKCQCPDATQVLKPASIPIGFCPAGYTNCNGVLLCAGC